MDMDCNCSIDVDAYLEDDYHDEMKTSDEVKKCCECHKDISPGDSYEKTTVSCYSYRTCSSCLSVREWFETWHFEYIWDDVYDYIQGCQGDIPESCIAALSPMARERVCKMIESEWEEEE